MTKENDFDDLADDDLDDLVSDDLAEKALAGDEDYKRIRQFLADYEAARPSSWSRPEPANVPTKKPERFTVSKPRAN